MNVKTVVVVNDFNYVQGGASKVAIDTAKLLNEKKVKVYFFSAVNKETENIEGVEYISTNQNEALKEKNKIKGIINGIYNLKAKKELKKLLEKLDRNTTIIHVHGWTKALSCSIFDIAFKMKFNVVLTLHDYFTACPNGGYYNFKQNEICTFEPLSAKCITCNCDSRNYLFKIYRCIRQFVQNNIVKLNVKLKYAISISNLSEQILRKTLPKNIEIYRIYNPINTNKTRIQPQNNKYYVFVGRVDKEKGVDIFCEALDRLKYKGIVVGTGSQMEYLQQKYKDIEFVGWKNKEEVLEYLKGARALVFPSRWYEGAPLTPLEAMSIGLPVISSSCCSAKEFIKDEEIIFNNSEDLVKVLEKYNNENEKIKVYSSNAIKQFEKYMDNKYEEELIKRYDKILYRENNGGKSER